MRIILASNSPRRRELLGRLFEDFEIITKPTDETLPEGVSLDVGVSELAVRKGRAVAEDISDDALIISADTLVELDGLPLGKPADEADAKATLMMLSGRTHNVHTGVAVHLGGRVYRAVDTAHVTFRAMSEDEIEEYIKSGEPMDKAGSYAIQGLGRKFVLSYDGDFDAIVGLGLKLTDELIKAAMREDEDLLL